MHHHNLRIYILFLLQYASLIAATTPQEATSFAFLYGYPLLAWRQLAAPVALTDNGINIFNHERELQNANSQDYVVKPNVDTLYSFMIYDLSHDDVVITIPKIPEDQFALFSFYDPYGNKFAQIGPENGDTEGEWRVVRRREGVHDHEGHEWGHHHGGRNVTDLKGTIVAPATYGSLFIRWLVNATNLDAIHTYQNGVKTQNVTKSSHEDGDLPYLTSLLFADYPKKPAENLLSQLARYAAIDGPEVQSDTPSVNGNLTLAGISNGTYTPVPSVNLTQANQTTLLQASNEYSEALVSLGNGWTMLAVNKTGDYGTNYGIRTAVAASVYVMVKAPTAIYPDWSSPNTTSSSGNVLSGADSIIVGANDSYIYTFSRKPPLKDLGFWSVTAYHNGYLIPNDLNVYTLGDRSNLTFPDGKLVYGDEEECEDGEFQILIQPADVAPPANWTSNWLPAPAGGGSMNAALRFYEGGEELLDGEYVFPKVTRQGAVRA